MFKPIWPSLFVACALVFVGYVVARNWGWWRTEDQFVRWFPVFVGLLVTFVLCGLAAALGYGLSEFIGEHSSQVWHRRWTGKMVSLRNADGVSGSLHGGVFLISGSIGSEQVFHYYTASRDGSLKPHSWTADSDVSVFEENRNDGEVVQFDEQFEHPWIDWFGIPGIRTRMDFHIPEGTLRRDFKLE